MTEPRQQSGSRRSLDDLLSRLPTPLPEPTEAEWMSRLERTMQRVHAGQHESGTPAAPHADPDLDHGDVLRTPLPVETGEPEPLDPYGFEADERALYDELRAPLQSGEHAPLGRPATESADIAATPSATLFSLRPQKSVNWIAGAIGMVAAAAAVALYVQRARVEPLAASLGLDHTKSIANPGANAPVAATPGDEPKAVAATLDVPATAPPPQTDSTEPTRSTTSDHSNLHVALATKSAPKPAAASTPAAVEPSTSEPDLTPAAGPASLDDHPASGAVMAAIGRVAPEGQHCLSPALPKVPIRVVFRSTGIVDRVDILSSVADPKTRQCLAAAYGKLRVQPFARAQFDVNTTISLPAAP